MWKLVLQDALQLAVLAGKAYEARDDERFDDGTGGWKREMQAKGDRLMKDAWEHLATLPGDVGESAQAELARMTEK